MSENQWLTGTFFNELFADEITEMKAIIAAKLQQSCNMGFFIQLVKSRLLIPYVLTI
jgi:hypothetical protein